MPARKLLLRKAHKQYVPELDREVTLSKELVRYVKDATNDVQTPLGIIRKNELKKKPGSTVKSGQGKDFTLIDADFIDDLMHINRLPQTMPLKDIGLIIATTGVNKDSTAIDAGTGSGMLACFLAHQCKHVTSYEVDEKNIAVAKQNASVLSLKNLIIKKGSIYNKIPEKNADLLVLDVPEPTKAIDTAAKALAIGGFLAVYTIQATQLQSVVNALLNDKRFWLLKSSELLERLWKVDGRIVRPHNTPIGHSGFITFARRVC
jgi:tRNA (adenine57-N1/adenine58-N1)-methyltransferase